MFRSVNERIIILFALIIKQDNYFSGRMNASVRKREDNYLVHHNSLNKLVFFFLSSMKASAR